jgi:GNAT superfamily N-acetyltransferase
MVTIRRYQPEDSIEAITDLLQRGYARLADMGFRYMATWQTPDITLDRITSGTGFLAVDGDQIVGTVTVYEPYESSNCAVYCDPHIYRFGQFTVDPDRQGEGIGKLLYQQVENFALSKGAHGLACDTAEGATHLIEMYRRWGYEIVDRQDWDVTNYVSVVLAKRLGH